MTLAPEATTEPSQRASTTEAWSVDAAEVSAVAGEALRAPPRSLLEARSPEVAPALLGMVVAKRGADGLVAGRIVEVEAYDGPEDRASHARAGRTPRTAVMFGPAGPRLRLPRLRDAPLPERRVRAGRRGGAVLIRALEPVAGLDRDARPSRRRRARAGRTGSRPGPARLCQALGIDRRDDGQRPAR